MFGGKGWCMRRSWWADNLVENEAGQLGCCCKVCVYYHHFNDIAECQPFNIAANYGMRVISNLKADFLTALCVYKIATSNVSCQTTLYVN